MQEHKRTLAEVSASDEFIGRHIGPRQSELRSMLEYLGAESTQALMGKVVPAAIADNAALDMSQACSEAEALAALRQIASKNTVFKSFIGQGYYNSFLPAVIQRNVLESPAWYTAYTPYQPEISQGRLEALLNFQTVVTDLTGMDIANASMLDEATAAAEAMALCRRQSRARGNVFFVDRDTMPQTIAVLRTRAEPIGIELQLGDPAGDYKPENCFGALVQYPGASGAIGDHEALIASAHAAGNLVVVAADLLAMVMLRGPGDIGADVVIGSSQRFGVPLGFGGPHAAFFATREKFKRSMPGRLVGVSIDSHGQPAYRLALQTREQHIRREKATSNICTAQVLLAVMAGMYAVYHGPQGLARIARRVNLLTDVLAAGIRQLGIGIVNDSWFDTLTIALAGQAESVHQRALDMGINLRRIDGDHVGISLDETATPQDVENVWEILQPGAALSFGALEANASPAVPEHLLRVDAVLSHPVFSSHHSETAMLRYLRRLSDKDIALDRSMIALGSCTMKLNATSEMLPVTWEAFGNIHPYAPLDQAGGYLELFEQLEKMLCVVTGYDAVSLQPNAGSQGEYAGLLAICAYHRSRGEGGRNICLIPSSAHGTNPASAHMCGLKVVVVACDEQGNVDLADLQSKIDRHPGEVAALMVTYPSTHGVFEEGIVEVCKMVHDAGGQVYIDGANMNAMVGLCRPGAFGGDVSHLNLHKTFCIPHGGGGPGVGPIGVAAHLEPFLPATDTAYQESASDGVGAVSAAPWGSAGILPISWMYMKMMGANGLRQATEAAIINANYVARRLSEHFPILYTGSAGLVAHECIVDLRPLKEECGVDVEDVAKRLIDFGFHSPTMSFPVAGTLMIEPTESEDLAELDRFCDAMIAIRLEIAQIESGEVSLEDSPLSHAPHPAAMVGGDQWQQSYTREQAAWPLAFVKEQKYWVPVGRIDNVYGDRNLMCSCPPISDYEDQTIAAGPDK
jgi:glycine cleavage system P protein (glycine dehydrogenase)